jgi:hypothetical protein
LRKRLEMRWGNEEMRMKRGERENEKEEGRKRK